MKTRVLVMIALLLSAISLQAEVPSRVIDNDLSKFQSVNWSTREGAFYDLTKLSSTDPNTEFPVSDGLLALLRTNPDARSRIVSALNQLLDTESSVTDSGAAPETEEFSNHHGYLIQAVTSLRDPSPLPVLLKSVKTGGMAINAVAGGGDQALSEVIKRIPSADDETRRSLYRVLAGMSEQRNLEKFQKLDSAAMLFSALVAGASDKDPWTRVVVAQRLAHVHTPEATAALNRLAQDDGYVESDKSMPRYPVREAAIRALTDKQAK